jgi:hypothetical protein
MRLFTDEYYDALGRFIADFSEIEGAMQIALWHFAKVKTPIAQAVFSGVRSDDACNKITRIADAENWPEERKIIWQEISSRLGLLRTLRNDIVHYGAEWVAPNTWIATNDMFVHAPKKITNTPVTITILSDATADLQKLSLLLFNFIFADEMTALGKLSIRQALERAWRYIPPQPTGNADKSRSTAPKQKRPPASSRKSPRLSSRQRRERAMSQRKKPPAPEIKE